MYMYMYSLVSHLSLTGRPLIPLLERHRVLNAQCRSSLLSTPTPTTIPTLQFAEIDINNDGVIDSEELRETVDGAMQAPHGTIRWIVPCRHHMVQWTVMAVGLMWFCALTY